MSYETEHLTKAIEIIETARFHAAGTEKDVWNFLYHAGQHLKKQRDALTPLDPFTPSACNFGVYASERGGGPFDIRIVDCGHPTVPCKQCGQDTELCAKHCDSEICFECEYHGMKPQRNLPMGGVA